ncbi:BBSome complex assembly protein BBS10 isoform 1-T1 [Pelodytes ibericus]
MQKSALEININKVLQVAESLENILCRCFGPNGRHVLFTKATGELLITKDGRKVLECLLLQHPIARMIVNSACSHSKLTGDGVKSFVIMLCGVLRGLRAHTDKNGGQLLCENTLGRNRYQMQGHALKRISNLLMTFHSEVLEHMIYKHLTQHSLPILSTKKGLLCRASLQSVMYTYFCGRLGHNNQEFISRLACDFFYKCLLHSDSALELVELIKMYFPEMHTEVPGHAVDNSRILQGIVLHRQFSVYCPAEGELRALIVSQEIHQTLSASDVDFVVCSDSHLELSQNCLRQRTENIIKQLQNNQIKLILSSVKQSEIVHYFSNQSGISLVECVAPEEIDFVCRITGVSPLCIPLGTDVLSNHMTDSFLVGCCRPVVIGSKNYAHLILTSCLGFQPHSVVICGPVKGLTEQFISAFHGAFKMLRQLFQPIDASWEETRDNRDHCKVNESVSTPEQSITNCSCQKAACCDFSLHRIHSTINSPDHDQSQLSERVFGDGTINVNDGSYKGLQPNHMCLIKEEQEISQPIYSVKAITNSSEMASRVSCRKDPIVSKFNRPAVTDGQLHSTSLAGLVLPGGGTFEILLHYQLNELSRKFQNQDLAAACTIVGDALLCIPRYIHSARKGNGSFPLVYSQVISAYHGKDIENTARAGLESVSCKYQLLVSVLHCVSKLVTIDFIIGTKKAPHNAESEESDNDL